MVEGVNWVHLAQGRETVGSCEHGSDPLGSHKNSKFLDQLRD